MRLPKSSLGLKLFVLLFFVLLIPIAGNLFWLQVFLHNYPQNPLAILFFVLVYLGTLLVAVLVYLLIRKEMSELGNKQETDDTKLDFVTMAAHELRTPLTSLKGYVAVFLQENKDTFSAEQNMFLKRIEISAYQLADLVENLLNVSRIERGAFILEKESLDWMENLKQVVLEFSSRAAERQLTFTLKEPEGEIGKLYVDKLRMNEVLGNLLANAISYTESGGAVTVSVESTGDEVITHIQDTGQGIPKEALPKLFTKFFRVSGALESGSKGTGLGLYLSKVILDMHHGKIWVESVLGKGSTFSFSMPRKVKE